MRIAVVGHVEWVEFVRVDHVPIAGEILQGTPMLAVPAGGGGVAAVQLARWGAESIFFTALGDDERGHRAASELRARGVTVHSVFRRESQRSAITMIDAQRERTILLTGERHVPTAADPLPWAELATCDAVYVTGGDPGAVRNARAARVMVGTSRVLPLLRSAGVQLDALVGSSRDPREVYVDGDLELRPQLVVRTDGEHGGVYVLPDGSRHAYAAVPTVMTGDTYGAGDSFAAALTYSLGMNHDPATAIAFAAVRASEVVTFNGPYPP